MRFNPDDLQPPFGHGKLEIDGVEHDVPYVTVQYGQTPIVLHWGNATIRSFYYDPSLNHVEYREPGNPVKGIRMSQKLIDLMEQYGFPLERDPIPDDSTRDWFVDMEVSALDDELNALGELGE